MGDRPERDKQDAIVDRALDNLRVSAAARRLMKYYASQATGFRPSLKTISEVAHINSQNISRTRQNLVDSGFIGYDGDTIVIDWVRLRGFASLQSELMGKKSDWNVSPVDSKALDIPNIDVHNYNMLQSFEDQKLYNSYVATAQALLDGVAFPELENEEVPDIDSNLLGDTNIDVHNYIGDGDFKWFNPFDEPDPIWVYQIPLLDAYGHVVRMAHYNTNLPF